jgi:hypothetical protein
MKAKKRGSAANRSPKVSHPFPTQGDHRVIEAISSLGIFPPRPPSSPIDAGEWIANILDSVRMSDYRSPTYIRARILAAIWVYIKVALSLGDDPYDVVEWVDHLNRRSPCGMCLDFADIWGMVHEAQRFVGNHMLHDAQNHLRHKQAVH